MTRATQNTKERARTIELLAKMMVRSEGIKMEDAREIASLHICGTITNPETIKGSMATYAPARAFIEATIAQLTEINAEGVAFFDGNAQEKVSFDVRTKRDAQLAQVFADVVATRARFSSVATMTDYLTSGGFIVLRNGQHSMSAYNFVSINANDELVNSMLYASGGHDNGARMILAPMTVHSGNDADVVAHIEEEIKVLSVRACGCPVLWRDPLGTLDALTKRGLATGARAVATGIVSRHAREVTPSNDVRQTLAHRWDISGIWNDADDVADWLEREVKRGHEGTL
jgi:hypothetical protein